MCGIAGWIDYSKNLYEKDKIMDIMSQTLVQRGPDDNGIFKTNQAYLVHRRLVVVDPENGRQPMTRKTDNDEFTIIYNGELYNTEDIKKKLIELGHIFSGHSDTEVLLKAYMEWGEKCLDELNGIYAFAIWNKKDEKLFVARDRMGVKPFFYHKYNGGLIFGSQIKTVLAHPYVEPIINEEGVASIMMLGPAKTPGDGVFKDIYELKPGYYGIFSKEGFEIKPYWKLEAKEHKDNLQQTVEHIRYLVTDSIKRQLVSDVPLCTFLSGGLDSSIISAVANEEYKDKGLELSTYSIDYKDNAKYFKSSVFQPNADAPWIELMVDFLGSKHTNIIVDSPMLVDALYDAVIARDLPGMADVDSSLMILCQEIKKNFVVGISGECADEIFGGYPWYHNEEILFKDNFPWAQSTDLRFNLLNENVLKRIDPVEYVQSRYRETVNATSRFDNDSKLDARMKEMFMLNINWFMQTLLDRKDRMSMACGLEVRVPFCDHRITEYAYNIPWEIKSSGDREKGLLRKAVSGILPDEIITRKKSPYPKTHNPSYLEKVKGILQSVVNDKNSRIFEIVPKNKLQQLIDTNAECFDKPWYGQLMTDAQIMAYLIQVEYWLKHFDVKIV